MIKSSKILNLRVKKEKLLLFKFILLVLISNVLVAQTEICNNGIDDDNDGYIDCFDQDCSGNTDCKDAFLWQPLEGCQKDLTGDSLFTMKVFWESVAGGTIHNASGEVTPLIGNIDGDCSPEVIVVRSQALASNKNVIYIHDGLTGERKTTIATDISANLNIGNVVFGDVDNDGFAEIFLGVREQVASENSYLISWNHDGTLRWKTGPIVNVHTDDKPSLTDFDMDGIPEVEMFPYIFDAQTGNMYNTTIDQTFPGMQIIACAYPADVLDSSALCPECSGPEIIYNSIVFGVDLVTGNIRKRAYVDTVNNNILSHSSVADMDLDGKLDIIVSPIISGPNNGELYIWDPRLNQKISNDFDLTPIQKNNNQSGGRPLIANFDSDPFPEICVFGKAPNSSSQIVVYVLDYDPVNDTLIEKWQRLIIDDGNNVNHPTAFDFDCDGIYEIVTRLTDGLYIIDGQTGQTKSYHSGCTDLLWQTSPVVADVDNDGHAEIVCLCATGGSGTYLKAFKDTFNVWPAARTIWNETDYRPNLLNENFSVPSNVQNSTLAGLEMLNTFRAQVHVYDEAGASVCLKDFVYDLSLIVLSVDTPDVTLCEPVKIDVEVRNITPKRCYQDSMLRLTVYDPAGQALLFDTLLNVLIMSDSSFTISFEIQNYTTQMILYINDVASDFNTAPLFAIEECDFDNNKDSIFLNVETPIKRDTVEVCNGIEVTLNAGDGSGYIWSPTVGIDNPIGQAVLLTAIVDTVYSVEYINTLGCNSTDEFKIQFLHPDSCDYFIFVPNVFSPNNDGVNDLFKVQMYGLNILNFTIYDRFGTAVFNSGNAISWDGKMGNKPVTQGNYVYRINAETIDGTLIERRGNVLVSY